MFQVFIDNANASIFGVDPLGKIKLWNLRTAELTGFSREQAIDRDIVSCMQGINHLNNYFLAPEDQMSIKQVMDSALRGDETSNFEFQMYTANGGRIHLLMNATTWRDDNGILLGAIAICQDITERKRVEVEKARIAQELQTFIDTANAPILGIDAEGLVNEWNNKAAAITGFSRKEVLGKNLVKVCFLNFYY
jgi:PAS domain S-box-containing protein